MSERFVVLMSVKGDPRGIWYDIEDSEEKAANLTARSELMTVIRKRINDAGWTQAEAARVLHVTQPRVSDLLNGKLSKFSVDALGDMLRRAGQC